jgi:glycosyltransferase involved in cell wall biosynthesis
MFESKRGNHKLRVMRIVTASYVVPWHLGNTLKRMPRDFETYVVGQGVSAYRETYPEVHWIDLDLDRKISIGRDFWALMKLCRIFLSVRPDIVHSIMPKSGLLTALAGFLCRVPVRMHTFTGQVWATRAGLSRFFFYTIDKVILVLNSLCMTDSASQSAYLYENGFALNGAPLPHLAYGSLSGVDLQRFRSDTNMRKLTRDKLNIPQDSFIFLFVGRLSREKGLLDLANAFASLGNDKSYLLLVGPDEEGIAHELRHAAHSCIERVRIVGFTHNPEEYMAASDIFCIPSYREGFGSVVIEAAAVGIPAIGTRIPGLVDAIADGKTGVLVPIEDVSALAEAMGRLSERSEILEVMSEQARSRAAELFSADVVYAALRMTYRELLQRP